MIKLELIFEIILVVECSLLHSLTCIMIENNQIEKERNYIYEKT
jgi:hypothetical protein